MEQPKALSTYMTDRIDASGGQDACWIWTAYVDVHGYGVDARQQPPRKAHRTVYAALVGSIPEGLHLDHLCHNNDLTCTGSKRGCPHRRCVNPAHLEPVTQSENSLRATARNGPTGVAAVSAAQTTCIRGHVFDGLAKSGQRTCSACRRELHKRKKAA